MFKIKIIIISIFSVFTLHGFSQHVQIDTNAVCSKKKIPDHDNVTIDPYNLPASCLEYNEYGSLNLDLVFEEYFTAPTMDLTKWVGHESQRAKLINNIPNPYGLVKRPGTLDFYDGPATLPGNFDLTTPGILKLKAKQVTPFWDNVYAYHRGTNAAPNTGPCDTLTLDYGNCILEDNFPNKRQFKYTSGALTSERSFKYGYFEMRCKVPLVDGVFPAFWLYMNGGNRTEIDIFEFVQSETDDACVPENKDIASQRMFITYWDHQGNGTPASNPEKCSSRDVKAIDFILASNWHIYSLYWDEFKMIWFLDGSPIYTRYQYTWIKRNRFGTITGAGGIDHCTELAEKASDPTTTLHVDYYYPDEQCHILVTMAVPNFGGAYDPVNDQTCGTLVGETAMEIDYIRAYGIRACDDPDGTVYYCSDNPTHVASTITAPTLLNIAGNCDVIVKNHRPEYLWDEYYTESHTVDATAGTEINLWPGFEAQQGSTFTASLQPCTTADLRLAAPEDSPPLSNQTIAMQVQQGIKQGDEMLQKQYLSHEVTEPTLQLFPNPAQQSVYINWNGVESSAKINIIDLTGKTLLAQEVERFNGHQLNVQTLSNGIYTVQAQIDGRVYAQKLVISK